MNATSLFDIMANHVIVAADETLSMVAAWDGDNMIKYYSLYNYDKFAENDVYTADEELSIDDARAISVIYFEDVHKDMSKAA
jgi:hypothetical protein